MEDRPSMTATFCTANAAPFSGESEVRGAAQATLARKMPNANWLVGVTKLSLKSKRRRSVMAVCDTGFGAVTSGSQSMLRARITLLVVVCAGLIGCKESAAPDTQTLLERLNDTTTTFQTDEREYAFTPTVIGHETRIGMSFTNSTGHDVYMVNCSGGVGWSLEKFVNGHWEHVYSPVMLGCLSQPITVIRNGRRRFAITIYVPREGSNIFPRFEGADIAGVYRVVWHGLVRNYELPAGPWSNELPLKNRISNAFILAAP